MFRKSKHSGKVFWAAGLAAAACIIFSFIYMVGRSVLDYTECR